LREAREDKLKRNLPGFTRQDWAYQMAATANTDATRLVINVPNKGGNTWKAISRSAIGSEPIIDLPEYVSEPVKNARILKRMARTFGASDAGVCLLDRRWVYSHYFDPETMEAFPIHFSDEPGFEGNFEPGMLENRHQVIPSELKYVLVLIHEMDYTGICTAPTLTQMASTLRTYSEISYTIISIAEFIRGLGFQAIPSVNCTAISIPLAIDAGLGELGRNAKLVHPCFGPRCRISKVFTDLPLAPDRPISIGATQFCAVCKKCAQACPSKAIPEGDRSFEPVGIFSNYGVLQWQVNHDRCKKYQAKIGTNCGICIKSCSYNKPNGLPHRLVTSLIASAPIFNRLILKGENIFNFGRLKHTEEFWQ
jgi:reductive dehalogenase